MSDENNLWECDKKKINKEFSNPVGKLIKDIKADVERQNGYEEGRKQSALEELDLFNKLIEEKKVDRIFNNAYNITIEVVAYANLKNHIEKRKENLKEEGVEK
jgi:hypothetical protein